MKIKFIFYIFLAVTAVSFAQDNSKSVVIKKNRRPESYPLIRPVSPSYTLMAGYILREKAKKGDPFAEHELGIRYLLGRGFRPDTARAVYWIKKAVKSDIPAINFNYGIMLNNGIGVEWNPFEAFKNFEKAAESNMPAAQFMLGLFYLDNLVVNKNLIEAYKWFEKSSQNGYKEAGKILKELGKNSKIKLNPEAKSPPEKKRKGKEISSALMSKPEEFELEYLSFSSDTTKIKSRNADLVKEILKEKPSEIRKYLGISDTSLFVDDTSGIDLVYYTAGLGNPEALYLIGNLEENKNSDENNLKALSYYLQAYRLGSYKAIENIYAMLNNAFLRPYLKKQLKKENPLAMYVWAALIAYDFDVSVTKEEALKLLEKAANKNHVPSLIELGLLYKNGSMVPKNVKKAEKFFERAAALGSKEAEIRLAFLRITEFAKSNLKKEINLIKKYAEEGSVIAQTDLAYCYENGLGIKRNKAQAAKLYRIAASRGNRTAFSSLKRMYDEIRPEDQIFQILN